MYSKRIKEIADQIEALRLEIYSGLNMHTDYTDDKRELDDLLFMIQSKLRFDAVTILEYYEVDA